MMSMNKYGFKISRLPYSGFIIFRGKLLQKSKHSKSAERPETVLNGSQHESEMAPTVGQRQ